MLAQPLSALLQPGRLQLASAAHVGPSGSLASPPSSVTSLHLRLRTSMHSCASQGCW